MGVIARWRDRLPVGPATPELTLGEGGTPLVRSERLSERLGVELWFKFEGANPTGSFKDRGMVVAVAKAMEEGARVLVCASTGNTSASAAAYAASQRLRAIVVVPAGEIALAVRLSNARLLALNIATEHYRIEEELETISRIVSGSTQVWISGAAASRQRVHIGRANWFLVRDLEELDDKLKR